MRPERSESIPQIISVGLFLLLKENTVSDDMGLAYLPNMLRRRWNPLPSVISFEKKSPRSSLANPAMESAVLCLLALLFSMFLMWQ